MSFLPILAAKGFTHEASGRYFSPDAKRGDGCIVELYDGTATVIWSDRWSRYEATPRDLERFREDVQ